MTWLLVIYIIIGETNQKIVVNSYSSHSECEMAAEFFLDDDSECVIYQQDSKSIVEGYLKEKEEQK